MRALTLIRTDPSLRIIAVLMVLTGALTCSFGPDAALLAVKMFGLGARGYALLPATSTLLSVAACALSVFGIALMVVAPGRVRFILAQGVLLPLSSTCFGQLFAQARLAVQRQPAAERAADDPRPVGAAVCGGAAVVGAGLRAALRDLAQLPLALRVPVLGAVNSGGTNCWAVLPLVLVGEVGRGTALSEYGLSDYGLSEYGLVAVLTVCVTVLGALALHLAEPAV